MHSDENNGQSPMNQMILAKRNGTERIIKNEHRKISIKYEQLKKSVEEARARNKKMNEEFDILTHQNLLLSSQIDKLKSSIEELNTNITKVTCGTDEYMASINQVNMIIEKETKTLALTRDKMKSKESELNRFWEEFDANNNIELLQIQKAQLLEKKANLEQQIEKMKEKNVGSSVSKLTEDCMILKKRNAAIQKRMTKLLEHLEQQVEQKKYQN